MDKYDLGVYTIIGIVAYTGYVISNKIKKLEEKLPNKIIQIQENLDSSLLEGKVKNTYMCYESEDKLLCSPSRKYNITPKFP